VAKLIGADAAALGHELEAFLGLQSANENGAGFSFGLGDDVEAVDLVDSVDVAGSADLVENARRRAASGAVAGEVLRAQVGFGLHDDTGRAPADIGHEPGAQELSGEPNGALQVKLSISRFHR
jgi:hypothetical protein